jgi:hypothetical protein
MIRVLIIVTLFLFGVFIDRIFYIDADMVVVSSIGFIGFALLLIQVNRLEAEKDRLTIITDLMTVCSKQKDENYDQLLCEVASLTAKIEEIETSDRAAVEWAEAERETGRGPSMSKPTAEPRIPGELWALARREDGLFLITMAYGHGIVTWPTEELARRNAHGDLYPVRIGVSPDRSWHEHATRDEAVAAVRAAAGLTEPEGSES